MRLFRYVLLLLPVLLAMNPAPASAEQLPTVVVTGEPVAPLPAEPGTGLCSTSRISTDPAADFPQSNSGFAGGVNTFLETPPNASNPNARVTSVLRTRFDLSNNNASGTKLSYGDYVDEVSGCPSGGCGFFVNDAATSFATRLRGYLKITSEQVGIPVHFGFYADDAVAFSIYDRTNRSYQVINRPPRIGFPTYRTTNGVTFMKPGLYPVEVLYAEFGEHAALEMAILEGTFSDFERPANESPIVKLDAVGFRLASPELFYQSETGQPSFPELDKCVQCNRQYANTAGNNGCDRGYYCNGAAVCDVCDTPSFCGASCSPCGAATPFCVARSRDHVCVECRQNTDCTAPDACHVGVCDAAGTCSFPAVMDGMVCPGGTCQAGVCLPLDAGSPDGSIPDGGGAGSDAGTGPDGGDVGPDGGGADGGDVGPDGGGASDGGPTGGEPDGGLGSDAGTDPGSGDGDACTDGQPTGCGCGTAVPALAPLAFLGLALLMRVRRTRFK